MLAGLVFQSSEAVAVIVGTPKDLAGAIALLASDDAGFVTGAYLPLSRGGQMS